MKLIRDKVAISPFPQLEETIRAVGATAVLNVSREENWGPPSTVEYAKIPLDNDRNHAAEVMAAVHVLRGLSERHVRVVVCCQVAMNRSPAVVAIWLAQQYDLTWQQALVEVKAVRPTLDIHDGISSLIPEVLPYRPKPRRCLCEELQT